MRSVLLLVKWRLLVRRSTLLWVLTLQTLVSAGVVIEFGFLQPSAARTNALSSSAAPPL